MLGSVTVLEHRGDGKIICSSCGLVRGRPNAGGPEREMAASLFNQVLVDVHARHGGSIEVEGLRGQYQKVRTLIAWVLAGASQHGQYTYQVGR